MREKRSVRGGALLEFAMALPFALILFLLIGDFALFFWRQAQMEEVSRAVAAQISPERTRYLPADDAGLRHLADGLRVKLQSHGGHESLAILLHRRYACPLLEGGEEAPTAAARQCAGERVYLRVECEETLQPLFRPLLAWGYPERAFSRHTLRLL